MGEVGAGATLGLAGVARQLDAVDGEHLAADQALPVTDEQDVAKQAADLGAQRADETSEGGEVRAAITGQGDEGDVFSAGPFDAATADDAPAVGEEDDLEQHGRRVGAGAGAVVLVAGIEAGEVEFVVDQVIERVFEAAREQLSLQIDGDEARAGVDVFVQRCEYFFYSFVRVSQ